MTITAPTTTTDRKDNGLPPCNVCHGTANVVYQATSDHPVPRCWEHAPPMAEAIALGWLTA